MRIAIYLPLAASTLLISACSFAPNCMGHKSYMDAKRFPPLKSPPGLAVPKPDPNMAIPKVANGPVGHYKQAPPGTNSDNPAARCLTTPPLMSTP